MPLLKLWRDELARSGRNVDLWFLSVDEDLPELSRFLDQHPEVAPGASLHLDQPGKVDSWLATLGSVPTGSIPVHVLLAPGGKVRCVRAGALREGDFPQVAALVSH
jgi:hypothetical protein